MDIGLYTVVAENKAGSCRTACRISLDLVPNVDETPLINPDVFRFLEKPLDAQQKPSDSDDERKNRERYIPPHVIVPLADARINQGEAFVLACKIDGYPKPKVYAALTSLLTHSHLDFIDTALQKFTFLTSMNRIRSRNYSGGHLTFF
jgi:hypothetical protein